VRSAPLALCDARTISADDLVTTELRLPHGVGESYSVLFSPGHRWFYFPEMSDEEAIVIKGFDSACDGRARFVPHSAFDLPAPEGVPRASIEVHALAFFGSPDSLV